MKLSVAHICWGLGAILWGYPAVASMFIKLDPAEDIKLMCVGIGIMLIAGRIMDNIKRG